VSLTTRRLGASDTLPLTLEVESGLVSESGLLLHLEGLPGLTVIAQKSWWMTDDFEAYFTYKGRLFILNTPFVQVCVSLVGQPPDDVAFSEVEAQVRSYRLPPLRAWRASWRYFWLPFNPPRRMVEDRESRTGPA
jgi:hypothetical protein